MIWAIYAPENLSARVRALLADRANEFIISYGVLWEILNKVGRGKLVLAGTSVTEVFGDDIEAFGVTLLSISIENILAAASLPHIHSDPFDRMFIAQAMAEGVPLVSIDDEIAKYPLPVIWQ